MTHYRIVAPKSEGTPERCREDDGRMFVLMANAVVAMGRHPRGECYCVVVEQEPQQKDSP